MTASRAGIVLSALASQEADGELTRRPALDAPEFMATKRIKIEEAKEMYQLSPSESWPSLETLRWRAGIKPKP